MLPELLGFSKVAQNCAHRSKIKMKATFAFVAGESGRSDVELFMSRT